MVKNKNIENFILASYHRFAPYYRTVGKTRGHFYSQAELLKEIINSLPKSINILDASCGTGDVLNELAETYNNINLFGTDGCERLIKESNNLKNRNKIFFNKCYWSDLKMCFNKEYFNFVFLLGNSIGHVDSINTFCGILDNINFILLKGGYFIFDLRPWEMNVKTPSFNEPYGANSNILFFTNNNIPIKYVSIYKYLDKRHHLIHEIYNQKTNSLLEKIELSFLDFSGHDLERIITSHGYDIINKYENYKKYPFLSYLIKKQ